MSNEALAAPEEPLFFNELGVRSIEIGVAAFHCMGVMPPHDHPHVFLNMGEDAVILCPYCSTEYRIDQALRRNETRPANCWAASANRLRPGFPDSLGFGQRAWNCG